MTHNNLIMQTILIATDFSEASKNASLYGIDLAKSIEARVVLLHVYPRVVPSPETGLMYTNAELESIANERLATEVNSLDTGDSVVIEKTTVQGSASEEIMKAAEAVNASFIVAGMQGGNTLARRLFGGTAFKLSRHSGVPVILVPESGWFKVPKVIALASDIQDETNMHILDPLQAFGEKFQSTIYIVRVIKKGMDELEERLLRPNRLKWLFKDLHPTYEFLNDNDVAHAMNDFVIDHGVDMVAMVREEHNLLERIFVKSNIREMIIQTHLPLMILPGKVPAVVNTPAGKLEEEIL
jgi:nucleotide-binding universal stress UspA family protein